MRLFEETVESKTLFRGKIVTLKQDVARLENGELANREVVEHPDGVCVLAMEDDGTVYTVKQFRYPFGRVVEELPAGKVDGDEGHERAARRELEEEVGAQAGELVYLGGLMMSPGFCNEVLHMYLARELRHGEQHPDEDEFIEVERVSFDRLYERVMEGSFPDGKSVATILKAREYLRRKTEGIL